MVSWGIMRVRARTIAAAGVALGLLLGAVPARSQEMSVTLHPTSRQRDIPWDRLPPPPPPPARRGRGGRDPPFRGHNPFFGFLPDPPDFAADVARVLREGKYRVRRVGDLYEADDGRGVRGLMKPILSEDGRRLFYLEGRYDPPLLPAMSGRVVIMLDSEHLDGPDGVTYCAMKFSGFLKLDSVGAAPLGGVVRVFSEDQMARGVRRFFNHGGAVSGRAYDDPEGLA